MDKMKMQEPGIQFKDLDGEKIFVKLGSNCEKIAANSLLQYTIELYGLFVQNNSKLSFLQMNVIEAKTQKICQIQRLQVPVRLITALRTGKMKWTW